jgi:hypothetical protein
MTALVPRLALEVKESFNDKHQLVADRVTFHGSDLKTAQDIQAGLAPTQQQVQQPATGSHVQSIYPPNFL